MQKKIRFAGVCMTVVLLMLSFAGATASALTGEEPYYSYRYTVWDSAVETAQSYLPDSVVSGLTLGCGSLKSPTGLAVTADRRVFVLDSGNNRVLELDEKMKLIREMKPVDGDGKPLAVKEPVSIYVNGRTGNIFVCDKAKGVLIFDRNLKLTDVLEAPDSPILPDGFLYAPMHVLMDSAGLYYVISENCYQGALQFDPHGKFIGFFGSDKVTLTMSTLVNYFWKQLLSEEQAGNMKRLVPTDFVSFCIDEKDFIYTIRKGNDVTSGQVKKLNALGSNILPDKFFGDRGVESALTAVAVDEDGFITILDSGSGRLFQYDVDGNLLYAFGGKGEQAGLTQEPSDIAALGDQLLILDKQTGLVTLFKPTSFARNIRKASTLYAEGHYQQAMSNWQEVLRRDSSYELANRGMGKAYEGLEEFDLAAVYYKKAYERALYSDAFSEVRSDWLRRHFAVFMLGMAAAILVPIVSVVVMRKKRKTVYTLRLKQSMYPFYCLTHPFIGYADMKERKGDNRNAAGLILIVFFIVSILNNQLTGFAFNNNRTDQFNLPFMFLSTVGIFMAFVICNWSITTIMDGKGRLKEIGNYCAYALLPYIIGTLVLIILSNVLTIGEMAFMKMGNTVVLAWTAISFLIALKEIHMYSLAKTIWTTILTVAGLVVILILCAIGYNVITQFFEFVGNIITELRAV